MKNTRSLMAAALLLACAALLALPRDIQGQAKPKDTSILKGSPLGGVKFEHKLHADTRDTKCEVCHHASKPEKPAKAPQQACTSCHTKTAAPPMKTNLQNAFHKPTGQSGLCIDCHKTANTKGKASPLKCMDCHKKGNV